MILQSKMNNIPSFSKRLMAYKYLKSIKFYEWIPTDKIPSVIRTIVVSIIDSDTQLYNTEIDETFSKFRKTELVPEVKEIKHTAPLKKHIHKGVYWHTRSSKWAVQTYINGYIKHIWYYNNPYIAIAAYKVAMAKLKLNACHLQRNI